MIPRQFVVATILLLVLAVSMSVYLWELRQRETANSRPREIEHVTPPHAGPAENVTVYVAYDNPGELRAQSISVPLASARQERAQELLQGLLKIYASKGSPHPLPANGEVRDVYLVEPGTAVLDINSALADGQASGVLAEELIVVSIIQTLSTNIPGITRVKILVDGKERETLAGHTDLSNFYEVSQVSALAKELAAP